MVVLKHGKNTSDCREILQLLQEKGTDFSLVDKENNTLLMMAVNYSIEDSDQLTTKTMVTFLCGKKQGDLFENADQIVESLHKTNNEGKTALSIAQNNGQKQAAIFLKAELKKASSLKKSTGNNLAAPNALKWGAVGVMTTLVFEVIAIPVIATKTNLFKNNTFLTLVVGVIILLACAALCAGVGYSRSKTQLDNPEAEEVASKKTNNL